MSDYLKELFIDEAKPALKRHSGGSGEKGSLFDSLVDRSLTEVSSNVTSIGNYAFYQCVDLLSADFPNTTSIGEYAFSRCTSLSTVTFPGVTFLGSYAFQNCTALTTAYFPVVETVKNLGFSRCTALEILDLPKVKVISPSAFSGCSLLKTLILRGNEVVTLEHNGALSGSAIGNLNGYIYVPKDLIEAYKVATNWSTYVSRFRALEDYTVDGTITGELDETKI